MNKDYVEIRNKEGILKVVEMFNQDLYMPKAWSQPELVN